MTTLSLLNAAAGATGEQTYIEDVFSTYLYTGNGSTQNIENGIALGASNYGGSITFSSTSSGISYADNSQFRPGASTPFTVECWFKASTGTSSYRFIYSKGYDNSGAIRVGANFTNGQVYVHYNGSLVIASSTTVNTNQWYHLALVKNSSGTLTLYINGTSNGSGSIGAITSTAQEDIGHNAYSDAFTGSISNFRFVNGTAVYTSNFTPPTQPLTAITGTALLIGKVENPLYDYSTNHFSPTSSSLVTASALGPFTSSTPGEGGMVWIKGRDSATNNDLFDTTRTSVLISNSSAAAGAGYVPTYFDFNSNGFFVGQGSDYNTGSVNYASWTFRKAPKFFDVVTYTGNGVYANTVAHSLGSVPGMIIIKRTDSTASWVVGSRGSSGTEYLSNTLRLNTTAAATTNGEFGASWTSTTFQVVDNLSAGYGDVNTPGATYVAYLFAHDTTTDGLIQCGSYTGTGVSGNSVTLGWEPQYLLVKNSSEANSNWLVIDNMRGMAETSSTITAANLASTEASGSYVTATSTGFKVLGTGIGFNTNGSTYIYMAIRRGPMKTPTDGTKVFSPISGQSPAGTIVTTEFPVDLQIAGQKNFNQTTKNWTVNDRLRGVSSTDTDKYAFMRTPSTAAEATTGGASAIATRAWNNTSYKIELGLDNIPSIYWNFRRAPGFFDVVCYTGTGVAMTINHNLGVAPELMIVKRRDTANSWFVYAAPRGADEYGLVNFSDAFFTPASLQWNSTAPTSTVFTVGTSTGVNASAGTYVAYLFASCPGVSKVGSYTGTGATQTISCGFTGGARFVLIKRTDSTGDWYVWDTARGMVAGTDPRLAFNLTAAETNANWVYTTTGGFQIVTTDASVNASGGSYIYLAVA